MNKRMTKKEAFRILKLYYDRKKNAMYRDDPAPSESLMLDALEVLLAHAQTEKEPKLYVLNIFHPAESGVLSSKKTKEFAEHDVVETSNGYYKVMFKPK